MQPVKRKSEIPYQIQIAQVDQSEQQNPDRASLRMKLDPSHRDVLYGEKVEQEVKQQKKQKRRPSLSIQAYTSLQKNQPQVMSQKSHVQDKKQIKVQKQLPKGPVTSVTSKLTQKRDRQIIQRYNPYQIPPNIDDSLFHQAATQFGTPLERNLSEYKKVNPEQTSRSYGSTSRNKEPNDGNEQQTTNEQQAKRPIFTDRQRCQCCGQQPKKKLPVSCRIEDIYKVNSSLGFYFTYVKVMIFMLLIAALSLGTYSTIQVFSSCDTSSNCIYIYGMPIERLHVFFNSITDIIAGCVICVMYFVAVYLYYVNAYEHRKVFLDENRPSNFSVLLANVDHQKVSGQAILDHFKDYQIVDILYTHQIKQYLNKLKEKQLYLAQKRLLEKKNNKKDVSKKIAKIQKKIDGINSYLFQIKKKLALDMQKSVRTDKLIIKFRTIQQKIHFQNRFRTSFCETLFNTCRGKSDLKINGNNLHLEHLGEPYQILWENYEIGPGKRFCRVIIGTFLTLVVLGGSFVFAAVILRLQNLNSVLNSGIISLIF